MGDSVLPHTFTSLDSLNEMWFRFIMKKTIFNMNNQCWKDDSISVKDLCDLTNWIDTAPYEDVKRWFWKKELNYMGATDEQFEEWMILHREDIPFMTALVTSPYYVRIRERLNEHPSYILEETTLSETDLGGIRKQSPDSESWNGEFYEYTVNLKIMQISNHGFPWVVGEPATFEEWVKIWQVIFDMRDYVIKFANDIKISGPLDCSVRSIKYWCRTPNKWGNSWLNHVQDVIYYIYWDFSNQDGNKYEISYAILCEQLYEKFGHLVGLNYYEEK